MIFKLLDGVNVKSAISLCSLVQTRSDSGLKNVDLNVKHETPLCSLLVSLNLEDFSKKSGNFAFDVLNNDPAKLFPVRDVLNNEQGGCLSKTAKSCGWFKDVQHRQSRFTYYSV